MKKVAIIYGWTEGQWQSKKLRQALQKNGFEVTRSAKQADILIAHSGGCFMLPKTAKASIIMLVGLPYWPHKNPLKSLYQKIATEKKDSWWLKKTCFNIFYFFTHPIKWFRMWVAWKKLNLPAADTAATIVSVRNKDDHFMHPVESEILMKQRGWDIKHLPGHHDDIWLNPTPYVAHLKELSKK